MPRGKRCDDSDRDGIMPRGADATHSRTLGSRVTGDGARFRGAATYCTLTFTSELPQPFAVMPPSPAAGNLSFCHGTDCATHPNRSVYMYDPNANDRHRGQRDDTGGPGRARSHASVSA